MFLSQKQPYFRYETAVLRTFLYSASSRITAATSSSSIAMSGLSVNPLQISGRRPQDMWASVLFALFFAATGIITIYQGHSLKNLAASCTDTEGNLRNVDLHLGGNTSAPEETDVTEILDGLIDACPYLIAAAAFATLFVSIWMVLLRYFAEQVIYATLITKGVALFGIAGYLCVFPIEEEPYWGLGCAAIGALYCLWICCARQRIALTAKLVEQFEAWCAGGTTAIFDLKRDIDELDIEYTSNPGHCSGFGAIVERVGRGMVRSMACGKEFTIVATHPYEGPTEEVARKLMEEEAIREEEERLQEEEEMRQRKKAEKRAAEDAAAAEKDAEQKALMAAEEEKKARSTTSAILMKDMGSRKGGS